MIARVIAAALPLAMSGCGLPADVVVLIPDESGTVGEVIVHEGTSTADLHRPLAAVNTGSEASLGNVFTAPQSDVSSEFAGALAATPRAPLIYTLYFETGSAELDARSRRDGFRCLQSGALLETRRSRTRRARRGGGSKRDHRDYLSRVRQPPCADA